MTDALAPVRSPIRLPRTGGRHRRPARLFLRWVGLLLATGAIGWLVHGVRSGGFDPSGPAWGLYWVHDALYLPLKGYLWTLWMPRGLAVWMVAVVLGLCGLLGFLTGRSPLHPLHRRTVLALLRRPSRHRLLNRWHAWTCKGRLRPRMLEILVEHERTRSLEVLDGPVPARSAELARLCAIAALSGTVRGRGSDAARDRPALAADLFETWTRLETPNEPPESWLARLEETMLRTLARLADDPDRDGGPLGAATLAADAIVLVEERRARRRGGLPDRRRLRTVAAGVAARRERLDLARLAAERRFGGRQPTAGPMPGGTDAVGVGRLSQLVAQALASEAGEPEIALTHLDSLSGVEFSGRGGGLESAPLTAASPTPLHHRLATPTVPDPPFPDADPPLAPAADPACRGPRWLPLLLAAGDAPEGS